MSATTDAAVQAQLLRRIAAQDTDAVAELYDQIAALLFSISVRILGDSQEAEEVIQDVFVRIWNKAADFDPSVGTALHWTVCITRNRSIDRLRSRTRHAQRQEQLEVFGWVDGAPDQESARPGLAEDELVTVRTTVQNLPADQRIVLELAFFGQQSHAEIAHAIGKPLGTVKARIRRAMIKLRDDLKAYA